MISAAFSAEDDRDEIHRRLSAITLDHGLAIDSLYGLKVIDLESRANSLFELSLQGLVESSQLLAVVTSWTYWLSQFTVLLDGATRDAERRMQLEGKVALITGGSRNIGLACGEALAEAGDDWRR